MRALALFWLSLAAAAQQAPPPSPPPSPPLLRITVTLVQVDAVVTDSHGRRVPNLEASDFELLQDGVPQQISYFSYVPAPEPLPAPPPVPKGQQAPRLAPEPITAAQVRRTIALVVDDLALSFDSVVRVRDALRKFVEQEMQPGDLVAVVRTGGGVALLEQFTTDQRLLLEAIDLLKWRFAGRVGLGAIQTMPGSEPVEVQRSPQMLDYGYTLSALGSLGTLEQVVHGMRQLPGRKSVVMLSDSLRVDPEIGSAIERLTDLANRSNVSIYTIDPRGLQAGMTAAEIADASESVPGPPRPLPGNRGAPDPNRPDPSWSDPGRTAPDSDNPVSFPLPPGAAPLESAGGLADLAKGTGGLFYANRNDIAGCIRDAAADQFGYYLLGYTPRQGTFDRDPEKARFHRVTVRLRRPGLRVRWKNGFNGVADELTLTEKTQKSREEQLAEALASPFAATGIKVRLTSLFTIAKSSGPCVYSLLHFDANGLDFIRDEKGAWRATVDILSNSYRGLKQTVIQRERVQEIALGDEQYQQALREGFLLGFTDVMKEPGMFLLRVVVRDHATGRIGSASQFVEVPDTRKGQLAMSGIALHLASPEIARAAGLTVQTSKDGEVEAYAEGGPAIRHYRPGQPIVYGYIVINAKSGGPRKLPQVSTQVRVYRDGREIYAGQPQQVKQKLPDTPADLVGAGVLRLGSELTPGEYLLQITVTDPLAKKKRRQASQWIDFEVLQPKRNGA
jgi:VWFA-related protein